MALERPFVPKHFKNTEGFSLKEIPGFFIREWTDYTTKLASINECKEKALRFLNNFNLTGRKTKKYTQHGKNITTWKVSYNPSKERKSIRTAKLNLTPVNILEKFELIESNTVNGTTASRRLIHNFDILGEGFLSIFDERVIISDLDPDNDVGFLEVNRIIYGYDNTTINEPMIFFANKVKINKKNRKIISETGLLSDDNFKRVLKLKYSTKFTSLSENMPIDTSIFPQSK